MIAVVCGPSGVGKSTLVAGLMARQPTLVFSVSHTTRKPRGNERDGVAYHFVDTAGFEAMVLAGEFAEHAQVHGHRYGTARSTLAAIERQGRVPILDIDYQGAVQIQAAYPDAMTVLVAPPSIADLESRLRGRGTDADAQIGLRLEAAKHELSQYGAFRYVVVNDNVDRAIDRIEAIFLAEEARTTRNQAFLKTLIADDS